MVINLFAAFGISVAMFIALVFLVLVYLWLKELIETKIYRYKFKHRFDKKPIAKCYCLDCRYRNQNYCTKTKGVVYDEWFCFHAYPRNKEWKDGCANQYNVNL